MKELIITADDYGMALSVNRAIEEGTECGIITSTNVMTNMAHCSQAASLRGRFPNLSLGIHWTLTAGRPISHPSAVSTLVDDQGEFYTHSTFRKRFRAGLILYQDIERELKAQYTAFCQICGKPNYWNTHQNIHVGFKLYSFFVDMAVTLGVDKMRSHQRIYVPPKHGMKSMSLSWQVMEPFKAKLLNSWQRAARRKGISSPDGVIVPLSANDRYDLKYLLENILWGPNERAELVIHPAVDNDCEYFGRIADDRITEYNMFSKPSTLDIIIASEVRLTTL